ncbi:hypothetical protein ON010_g19049 [Phytophthora cinnamomi]|nr:hypothetical protein ON010_g19049 [Phytophthora cinnamomi]
MITSPRAQRVTHCALCVESVARSGDVEVALHFNLDRSDLTPPQQPPATPPPSLQQGPPRDVRCIVLAPSKPRRDRRDWSSAAIGRKCVVKRPVRKVEAGRSRRLHGLPFPNAPASEKLLVLLRPPPPAHPSPYAMPKIVPGSDGTPLNVLEYEEYAREYLPKASMDYFASGSDSMETLRENREAFKRLVLHPRVLRDVSNMSTSTTLLGHRIGSPVCVAPSSTHRMAHPDGEIASSSAAAKADTCFVLSTMSTTTLEDVAAASSEANTDALRWFQLYVFKDRRE